MTNVGGYRERNYTADRALTVLQMFDESKPQISAAEVADELGVARSTAYRYVETLVRSGFLVEGTRGTFRLGSRILEMARIARIGFGLSQLCLPAMERVAETFGLTVLLTKRLNGVVVCLERSEAREQYVRLSYQQGTVLPLNAGASALVLLAWLSEDEARTALGASPLASFTDATLIDADRIIERLREIRANGVAVTYGEVDRHAVGIAAPVFGAKDSVIAAISVVLIRPLVPDDQIEAITQRVIEEAAGLSEEARRLEL